MSETPVQIPPQNKRIWIVGISLGLLFLIYVLRPVFALLAVSMGIAYILDPIVDRLESRRMGRSKAIGVLLFTFLLLTGLLGMIIVPPIFLQFDSLSEDLNRLVGDLENLITPLLIWLQEQTGKQIPVDFSSLKTVAPQWFEDMGPALQSRLSGIAGGLLTQGLGLLNTLLNLTLLPIFTFYLLRDWDLHKERLLGFVPMRLQPQLLVTAHEVDQRLNAFVRGQLTICFVLALLYTVGLWGVGLELALPIGLISGAMFVVPYLGTAIGMGVGCLLALINFGFDWHVLGVVGVFAVAQVIEGWILTPYIVGDKVGLPPLVVMISIIVGGSLLGIWGIALAIPITAVLSVIGQQWSQAYKESDYFKRISANDRP